MLRNKLLWMLGALSSRIVAATNIEPLSELVWGECEDSAFRSAGLGCGNFTVPVDWERPDGPNITLGLTRIKSTSASTKVLIFNPGGPGLTSSYWLHQFATNKTYLSDALKSHFDVIGIDSRGVGLSTPVHCDHQLWNLRPAQLVKTEADFHALAAFQEAFAQSCVVRSGSLVQHVSTVDVVRDYEAVRVALRQEKVSLLLQSYGTQIGSAFASYFPGSVDRMVLDGNVDHSLLETPALVSETYGLEKVWTLFVEWCACEPSCKAHKISVDAELSKLLDSATATPILSQECLSTGICKAYVRAEDIVGAIQSFLDYKELPPELAGENDTWQTLSEHLVEAFNGNVTAFSPPMALDDAGYTTTGPNGPWMQTPMINCLDWQAQSRQASDLMGQSRFTFSAAPNLRGLAQQYAINSMCFAWPFPVKDPPSVLNISNVGQPVLLVNSLFDPETPVDQTLGLKKQIHNAVVVMTERPGHTVYVQNGPGSKIVDAYLVNGTLPKTGLIVEY